MPLERPIALRRAAQLIIRTTPPFFNLNTSTPFSRGTMVPVTGVNVLMQLSSSTSLQSTPDESTAGSPDPVGGMYSKLIRLSSFLREPNAALSVLNPDERLCVGLADVEIVDGSTSVTSLLSAYCHIGRHAHSLAVVFEQPLGGVVYPLTTVRVQDKFPPSLIQCEHHTRRTARQDPAGAIPHARSLGFVHAFPAADHRRDVHTCSRHFLADKCGDAFVRIHDERAGMADQQGADSSGRGDSLQRK